MKIRLLLMLEILSALSISLKIKTLNNYTATKQILEYAVSQIYFSYLETNKISETVKIYLKEYDISFFDYEEGEEHYKFKLSKKYFSYLTNRDEPLIIEKYFEIMN